MDREDFVDGYWWSNRDLSADGRTLIWHRVGVSEAVIAKDLAVLARVLPHVQVVVQRKPLPTDNRSTMWREAVLTTAAQRRGSPHPYTQ